MGFLDNSTNNIIIDAVLTDLGRIALARNDGSFEIAKFALGDDEVDYGIIEKFGRTVGKEKIIKNTPVLDANTNSAVALQSKLVSLPIPNLNRVPIVQLTGDSNLDTSGSTPVLSVIKNKSVAFTLSQTINNEDRVPVQLVDTAFFVEADNRFLAINTGAPAFINTNNVATYRILRGVGAATTPKGGAILNLTVRAKSISDAQYTTFGNVSDKTLITTYLKVTGAQSGVQTTVEVQISKS